ncbi:MAG TPA: sulfatase [Acidobacteriota bacterium]
MKYAAIQGARVFAIFGLAESCFSDLIPRVFQRSELFWPSHPGTAALGLLLYPLAGALFGAALGPGLVWWGRQRPEVTAERLRRRCEAGAAILLLLLFSLHLALRYPSSRSALLLGGLGLGWALLWALRLRFDGSPSRLEPLADPWLAMPALTGLAWIAFEWNPEPRLKLVFGLLLLAGLSTGLWWLRRWGTHRRIRGAGHGLALSLVAAWIGSLAVNRPPRPALPELPGAAAAVNQPPVILIVLDTVRADHLTLYGYRRNTTPRLERWARGATLFPRCIAAGNYTLSSHASIFTGLYPVRHGAHYAPRGARAQQRLGARFATLAELLAAQGYLTAAIVSNFPFFAGTGLEQGFQYLDARPRRSFWNIPWKPYMLKHRVLEAVRLWLILPPVKWYRDAAEVKLEALELLRRLRSRPQPLFLFLNFMDAHDPYVPPAPYDAQFPGKLAGFDWEGQYLELQREVISRRRAIAPAERRHLISQYDGALAYLDAQLGELFGRLERESWYRRALVIVTSDHGEAFGENAVLRHGLSVYQSEIGVPLIVKLPGSARPAAPGRSASHVDLLPTVLDVLGLEPPPGLDGASLIAAAPPAERLVLAESYPTPSLARLDPRFRGTGRALIQGRHKYISWGSGFQELYDLTADPMERHDRFDSDAALAAELRRSLEAWLQAVEPPAEPEALDAESHRRLEALGY